MDRDYIERGIAHDGDYNNGIHKLKLERPEDFSRLTIKDKDGNLLATFTADKEGKITVDVPFE